MKDKKLSRTVRRVFRTAVILLIAAACLLGMLMFSLGAVERHRLRQAAAQYQAVTVRITDMRAPDESKHLLAVVLEPVSEHEPSDPGKPRPKERLGKTAATTGNRSLSVGDELTMYYDPQNTDTRIVDFKTAEPMLFFGGILGFGMLGVLIVLLLLRLMRRKRQQKPAAQIR